MTEQQSHLNKRVHLKQDGRRLYLYGWTLHDCPVTEELPPGPDPAPQCRWHPLRREWVAYAAHRQERTFKPPAAYCPLCPVLPGGFPTEVPFADYEVAVFENRFPAFHPNAPEPPLLAIDTTRAVGACEVMVYSSAHTGSLATLPDRRVELLLRVWADRYLDLLARPEVAFVMPFENRGEEVGVTLHHPHGQIYAFPFVPPAVQPMSDAFRSGSVLEDLQERTGGAYEVDGDADTTVLVPPCARFPFENWVLPRRRQPGPWALTDAAITSFARMLRRALARLDGLFQRSMPYIAVLYAAPKGEEDRFHFHLQILPFLRTAERLKYLAGCEQGAGTFLVDMLPETMVERLRAVSVVETEQ